MPEVYRTSIGWPFWSHIAIILIIVIPVTIFTWGTIGTFFIIPIAILILAYFMLAAVRTKYIFECDGLVIQNAISKKEIPYDSITKIVNTNRNPFNYSIIVMSMDRVELRYGRSGDELISPKDKEEFIRSIRSRSPHALYENDLKQ